MTLKSLPVDEKINLLLHVGTFKQINVYIMQNIEMFILSLPFKVVITF